MQKYNAVEHWAKIELPSQEGGAAALEEMRARVQRRYPAEAFNAARARLDPKNILGNELVDTLLGPPAAAPAAVAAAAAQ